MFPANPSTTSNPQAALRSSSRKLTLIGMWKCFGGVAQAGVAPSRPPPSASSATRLTSRPIRRPMTTFPLRAALALSRPCASLGGTPPTAAPSATMTPSRFMETPPNPALAGSAPRRRGLPVGLRWSWSIGPGPHSDLKCARMRLAGRSQCAFRRRCVGRTVSHNAWLVRGAAAVIDYRLLGPIEAGVDGRVLDIAGHKQLALLAVLVLRANQPVSRDVLVDWLWGEHPPPGVQHTLDVHISRLRKTLESAAGQQVVLTRPGAYLLRAAADNVDMRQFERLAEEGHRALAENAPDRAAAELSEALALWRGAPLADVSDEAFSQPEIARLNDLRMGIIEDRIEADLALGRHGGVVSELGALVAEHPLRERLYQLLMVALYRCGRQSEALAVYQQARRALVEELGIEPSPGLQRIERAVLAQDGSLDPPPRPAPALAPGHAREEGFPRTAAARRARLPTAIAAGLALILAVAFLGGRPQTPPVSAAPDTVAVINASRADLASVVAGIGRPGGIAYEAGTAWVTDTADGLLLRIDPAGQVVDRIPVGRGPAGVVAGAGEIWVANEFDNAVSQVNPRAGTVVATIPVGGGPVGLAYGSGSVWAANVTDATLSRIDP